MYQDCVRTVDPTHGDYSDWLDAVGWFYVMNWSSIFAISHFLWIGVWFGFHLASICFLMYTYAVSFMILR